MPAQPFIGQIMVFAGNFAPQGWAQCNGQLMPISQYDALFSLIGTTYGGDGQTTFALPDLRSRLPIHQGQGPGLSNYVPGENGGAEAVTPGLRRGSWRRAARPTTAHSQHNTQPMERP